MGYNCYYSLSPFFKVPSIEPMGGTLKTWMLKVKKPHVTLPSNSAILSQNLKSPTTFLNCGWLTSVVNHLLTLVKGSLNLASRTWNGKNTKMKGRINTKGQSRLKCCFVEIHFDFLFGKSKVQVTLNFKLWSICLPAISFLKLHWWCSYSVNGKVKFFSLLKQM